MQGSAQDVGTSGAGMTTGDGSKAPFYQRLFHTLMGEYESTDTAALVFTAVLVGAITGGVAVLFHYLILIIEQIAFGWLPTTLSGLGPSYLIIAPAVGGLLVGPLIYFFAREAKGHGVPEVMQAIALRGGRIRPIVAVVKSVASAITIGTGGSVGREGPIVQVGSALGSTIGQMMRLSDNRIRNMVASGAAAGVAAVFNAPIAGVFFALEVILGEFTTGNFALVVISSVTASVISRAAFGSNPAFVAPAYSVHSLWEYGLYPLLGVLAAITAVIYTRSLYWTEDLFDSWKRMPEWLRPAIGGVLLGLTGLLYTRIPAFGFTHMPHIFGGGYETIGTVLRGNGVIWVVLALMVLKIVATSLTLGSGASGGVFAPALFTGAMLGNGFGQLMQLVLPTVVVSPGAYALVGMAAVFAGATSAPITAVLILFEMTGDYRIILPLMLSVAIATALGRHLLHGESIYTLKLSRRGIRLSKGRDIDVMQGVEVREAMTPNPDTVSTNITLPELMQEFNATRHHGFPVLDENGELFGMVTLQDLERALERDMPPETTAADIATRDVMVAYPDETMSAVLRRFTVRGVGRMPVVEREHPTKLLGIVRRQDIVRAYNIALTRRAEVQHRASQLRLRDLDDTAFLEIQVADRAPCIGCTIAELSSAMPHDAVLVSIRRSNGQIVIPHGDTVLQVGDRVTAFANTRAAEALRSCLLANNLKNGGGVCPVRPTPRQDQSS